MLVSIIKSILGRQKKVKAVYQDKCKVKEENLVSRFEGYDSYGVLKIGNQEFQVYVGEVEESTEIDCWEEDSGITKKKFTLIER